MERWHIAAVVYLVFVTILWTFRPALMFDKDGNPKTLALENTESTSPIAPSVAFIVIGIFAYYIACIADAII